MGHCSLEDENNPTTGTTQGASILEDIINTKPQLTARLYPNLDKYYVHYCGGSWRGKRHQAAGRMADQIRKNIGVNPPQEITEL